MEETPTTVVVQAATSSDTKNYEQILTCVFGTFVFLQFTVLGLANHAGEGYLPTEQRELVYYALQVFVILGYVLNSLLFRFCRNMRIQKAIMYAVFGIFTACVAVMLVFAPDSLWYVIVSMVSVLCLGAIGGGAHYRMSMETVTDANVARCMGLGSAAAVVMQYLLQICWGVTPLLPVFMLAAVIVLFYLQRNAPKTAVEEGKAPETAAPRRIAVSIVIAAIFILFASFYNEYIHHLMIESSYSSYTVYSWPRLMLVPGYLLFAIIGDRKNGKYVPLASLCIMLIALLSVVLVGNQGAYWLNMCLFYFSIATFTSYYLLTFWRLAPGTKNPALWAPFGRMLDSGMVLLTGGIHISMLSAPVILGVDIAGAVLVIVLMALGGNLNLAEEKSAPEKPIASPEERVAQIARECSLTEREQEVLAALVLTEDKNQQIADEFGISRRQLQTHIAHIYEKTGTATRAAWL